MWGLRFCHALWAKQTEEINNDKEWPSCKVVYVLFDVHLSGVGANFALNLHTISRQHSRAISEEIKCPTSVNRHQIDTVLTYLLDVTSRDLFSLSIEEISFSFVRSPLFFTKKRQIIDVSNLLRSFLHRVNLFSHGCIFEWMWNDRIRMNVTKILDYKNKFSKHWAFFFYHPTFTVTWLNSPCYFISCNLLIHTQQDLITQCLLWMSAIKQQWLKTVVSLVCGLGLWGRVEQPIHCIGFWMTTFWHFRLSQDPKKKVWLINHPKAPVMSWHFQCNASTWTM